MLIGDDGEKLGMMPIEEALSSAQKKSLDLVPVSYTHLTLPTTPYV